MRYSLILADPPWTFENWSADEPGQIHDRARGANKHYVTATLDDICRLVPPAANDSILLMWTISSHLEDSFRVINAWGFDYKSIAWWWRKTTADGSRSRIGMGYWTRQVGELCLLATRGNPRPPINRSEPGEIEAPRGKRHSEKPEEQYAKIDRLFPDTYPRLEMFARVQRPGWDVFGNEVEGSIELDYASVQLAMGIA